jgi:hypothetical protein
MIPVYNVRGASIYTSERMSHQHNEKIVRSAVELECGCISILCQHMPVDLARIVRGYVLDVDVDRISDWLFKHTDSAFIGYTRKRGRNVPTEWTFSVRLYNGAVQLFAESEQYGCVKLFDSRILGACIKPDEIGAFLINLTYKKLWACAYSTMDEWISMHRNDDTERWILHALSTLRSNLNHYGNSRHIVRQGLFGRLGEQFNQALPSLMCH